MSMNGTPQSRYQPELFAENLNPSPKPKVQQILDALKADGWANAEWAHTGGGCYALQIPLGNPAQEDYSMIMITGCDVLISYDWASDDYLDGVWFIGGYDTEGEMIDATRLEEGFSEWSETLKAIVKAVNDSARA